MRVCFYGRMNIEGFWYSGLWTLVFRPMDTAKFPPGNDWNSSNHNKVKIKVKGSREILDQDCLLLMKWRSVSCHIKYDIMYILPLVICVYMISCIYYHSIGQFCWERKIVCISISEEERFIPRTFCQVWPLLGVQWCRLYQTTDVYLLIVWCQKVWVWCQHSQVPTVLL